VSRIRDYMVWRILAANEEQTDQFFLLASEVPEGLGLVLGLDLKTQVRTGIDRILRLTLSRY
jgi:hypothetical protein